MFTSPDSSDSSPEKNASTVVAFPFFPVATQKFIILSICSFGIYHAYWHYENWRRIKNRSNEDVSPFWRTFFMPLYGFSLFRRICATAELEGMPVDLNPYALAAIYLLLNMTPQLPNPWWLINIASFLPMLPIHEAAQRVNTRHVSSNSETINETYSPVNIATIIAGGLFMVFLVSSAFTLE
jgi:hypothetical protein